MINKNLRDLGKYLLVYKQSIAIVFTSLIVVSFSILSIGFVFRKLIDEGLVYKQTYVINNSIYFICLLIIIFAIGSFCRSYFINIISLNVTSKIKADMYRNLLSIDVETYENIKLGDIVSRLGVDIEMVGNLIINFLSFFIRNSIMLLGAITLMFIQSPKLSSLVLLSIPILLLPIIKLSKRVRLLSKQTLEEQGMFAANIEESFAGVRTLYAYNQQEYIANQFDRKLENYIDHAKIRLKFRSLFFALAITIIAGSITIVIWVGSLDILDGTMTSGGMVSFIYYAVMAGMSAGGIAELFSELQNSTAALDRVLELKDMRSGLKNNILLNDSNSNINFNTNIIYKNVSFSYPARPDILVLKNISLEIRSGIFTAIVGKSGAGKSTILQILLKFYLYKTGNIFIGEQDVALIPDNLLRSKISYVEQNPMIFSGTIRSNIIFSNPNSNEHEIEKVVEICGINKFISNLKFGINTEIGEKGVRLSGGQRQRIAIARALIYNPDILLLDEATGALDSDSENEILSNIRVALQGKTIISIAHRISSIEKADEILVINDGVLLSKGRHGKLLKECSLYKALLQESQ